MAEWLYEAGIGEARAALVERGRIVEMAIEPASDRPRAGAVIAARVSRAADASGRALIALAGGGEALLLGAQGVNEGAHLRVEMTREAQPEAGALKPAQARVAAEGAPLAPGPGLAARLARSGVPVRLLAGGDDALEACGWSEALEEAASGIVARPEALLRITPTPAMTLIDVDGDGPAAALALAGARLAGEAIRRFGITGSIGIDLPTLAAKADRQAAAAALDAALPPPFERTAVNGFGFFQIVRRRVRPSLVDWLATDSIGAAARARCLRRGERASGAGGLTLAGAPGVIDLLERREAWLAELAGRIGAPIALRADAALAISAGHAQRAFP